MRGPIPGLLDDPHLREISMRSGKEDTPQELIDWCDIVIMMHNAPTLDSHPQPWLDGNWTKFKKSKKPIIWRSIGQSNAQIEHVLKRFRKEGLKIVRHSPREDSIPGYQGADAMIRFYKNPDEYRDYNGQARRVVNVSQAMFGSDAVPSRGDHMSKDFFDKVVEGYDWKIFGPFNDYAGEHNGGMLAFEDLKQMLRFNRVYFYTGTRPAPYTLGLIEAMMTGMPIVSIGPDHGNEVYQDQKTFEVHDILGSRGDGSGNGFWSDSIDDLRNYIDMLLKDPNLATGIGQKGRIRAIELFGKQAVTNEWIKFFEKL